MDSMTLLLYAVAASAATITPGPTMLPALNNGATHGMRVAAYGIAGAALSDLILITAVGCGLGAILQASEYLFSMVKWVGAIYLLYLAWALWRAPAKLSPLAQSNAASDGRSAFWRSLLVALSNPKGLLFFSAFLPQFIHPQSDVAIQYITLAILTALIDITLMGVYAMGGHHAMKVLSGAGSEMAPSRLRRHAGRIGCCPQSLSPQHGELGARRRALPLRSTRSASSTIRLARRTPRCPLSPYRRQADRHADDCAGEYQETDGRPASAVASSVSSKVLSVNFCALKS